MQPTCACSLLCCCRHHALQLYLYGQTPAMIVQWALGGIQCYEEQQRLKADAYARQNQRRMAKMQQQCKAKLEEVHNGYKQVRGSMHGAARTARHAAHRAACHRPAAAAAAAALQAKRKYQEVAQVKNALEQDNQELQQKYMQKAT